MHDTLNPQQKEAICYLSGPLLVIAGAGSGKTRVISHKIMHLIHQDICAPHHIVALSFTNKAAQQMASTLKVHKDPRTQKVTTSTFHALGLHIIREEHKALGLKSGFSVFDGHDVHKCLRNLLPNNDKNIIMHAQRHISLWKNRNLTPEALLDMELEEDQKHYAIAYAQYVKQLYHYHAIDFDDLILRPTQLFAEYPEILHKWQDRIRYLLIDEYQDTSHMQYCLVKQLSYPRGALTAVGDDHQAIYAWRGANIENLSLLKTCYPHLKIIALEQNYRSTNAILHTANRLMETSSTTHMSKKELWSTRGEGTTPQLLCRAHNEEEQAQQVIMALLNHQRDTQSPNHAYAILYRSNHQSRALEAQLRQYHVPYTLSGGTSFFEKIEIKDICAYLRLVVNTDDDSAFLRAIQTPARGISTKTLETLSQYASQRNISLFASCFEMGFSTQISPKIYADIEQFCQFINDLEYRSIQESADEILISCVSTIRYEQYLYDHYDEKIAQERAEHVQHFIQWIKKLCLDQVETYTLKDLLQKLLLIQMIKDKDQKDAVHLSTIHAAKGLEYPYVFIIGCEEGILPHKENLHPQGIEEERRLMYVAVTRAQDHLWLSYCKPPHKEESKASRFLADMGIQEKPAETLSTEHSQQRLRHIASLLKSIEKEEVPI